MAGKNGKSNTTTPPLPPKPERAEFVGYVNLTLTEKDKADYESWSVDADLVSDGYLSALDLGYQFSIKLEQGKETYMCTVSQFNAGKPDSGLIYTARSNSPDGALLKGIYVVSRKMAYNLGNGYVKRQYLDAF